MCVRACVSGRARACVCAVVCAVYIQLKHCGFDPHQVRFHTSFFSFSTSGWLPTAKCVCLSMRGEKEEEKGKRNCHWPKTANGSCVVQDQALQQWWSIRSALQPERWCNSGTSTMLVHSRAIIAYGDGRSKVCVCACVYP